ncbi:uncharacterized protein LOC142319059 [Lycorma delicatula]|uniref:uncharacterized protein LOC142319059 n=1 Tax=Lycorma delicatula TaxID=130591 RepID=UPI003F51222D
MSTKKRISNSNKNQQSNKNDRQSKIISQVLPEKESGKEILKHSSLTEPKKLPREYIQKIKKYSAPASVISNVKKMSWPPLETFPAIDNSEVPRITVWVPFTKEHMTCLKDLNEEDTLCFFATHLPDYFSSLSKHFMKILLYDILKWSQRNNLNDNALSSLFGIYVNTHRYFMGSLWRNQEEVYKFFKQSILLHTIQDPPKSANILNPHECRSGLIYFCKTYLPVLPLLRVQLLPNYQLKLQWNSQHEGEVNKGNLQQPLKS